MAVAWVGLRMAGHVLHTGKAHVETRCAHVMGLPLVPLKSYLVVDDESGASIELPGLHEASVVAAYGRTYGPLLAVAGVAAMLAGAAVFPLNGLLVAAGLAGTVVGWRAGRLTADDRARYAVYARHIRHAVDPGHLAAAERRSLRDDLRAAVVDAAIVYAGKSYRDAGASPRDAWETVVLAPEVTDAELVACALTLARLETGLASDARQRRRYSAAHDALWTKLRALPTALPARRVEAPADGD